MLRVFRFSRLCAVAGLFTALLGAGCQEEGDFSFGPATFSLDGQAAAKDKDVAYGPCAELPNRQALVQEMLEAVNAERTRRGLLPVRLVESLTHVADFFACRLVEGGFFDHADPFDGSTVDTRAADFGYAFLKIGENLAAGQRSVQETMSDWIASPLHRANILDPAFTEIGIAVKAGGRFGPYWVQEFGRPITEPLRLDAGASSTDLAPPAKPQGPASQPASEAAPVATDSEADTEPADTPAVVGVYLWF